MKYLSKKLICIKPIVKQKTLQDLVNNDCFNCNIEVLENDFELINESMLQALSKVDNIEDYTTEKGALYATSILGVEWFEDVCSEVSLSVIFKIIKICKCKISFLVLQPIQIVSIIA